jgi:hypothetical protein
MANPAGESNAEHSDSISTAGCCSSFEIGVTSDAGPALSVV